MYGFQLNIFLSLRVFVRVSSCFFHNNNDTNNNLNIFIQDCCFSLGKKTAINAGPVGVVTYDPYALFFPTLF